MNQQDRTVLNTIKKKRRGPGVYKVTYKQNIVNQNPNGPRINEGYWFKNLKSQVDWYTDPNIRKANYEYKKLNPSDAKFEFEGLERASYVPYIKTRYGETYWLLGSFYDMPDIKVDFGGKCYEWVGGQKVQTETIPIDCATRELGEETEGVLTNPILSALQDKRGTVYRGVGSEGKVVVFIMVNMTDHLGELDTLQAGGKLHTMQREIDERAMQRQGGELFGPLGFYNQKELLNGNILTSFNLTDFITNAREGKIE